MKRLMKIAIFVVLAVLVAVGITVFAAADDTLVLSSWDELVETLAKLEEGEKLSVKVKDPGSNFSSDSINAAYSTAYIYADNVEITLVETDFIATTNSDGLISVMFGVAANGVTLNFKESFLQSYKGTAIEVDGNDCHINGATFVNCDYSDGYGSAIYITNYDAGCRINNCTFNNCKAKYGGAIYIDSDDVRIEGCSFKNCSATKEGSDVYDNNGDCVVSGCNTTNYNNNNTFAYVRKVESTDYYGTSLSSVISQGGILICAVVAVIAVAALVIVKKKKKPALADGAEKEAEK